ncbi:MAG TPA: alpha/beta hydrolase [Streptosporangiaceae bacterium]|nr:alpha/beta hydrolase [Streptosporangiaceae bacterium]
MLGSAAEFHAIELGDGPSLLLLHGVTANAAIWLPVMELLADSYHAVAVDQRGHGRTGLPRDGRFDAAAYARDAADLAAFLGGPVVLVGHSLGARNAIVAGAMRPDAVAGVVAIEFTPFIETAAFDALDARVVKGPRSFGDLGDLTGYLSWRYPGLPADAVSRRAAHGYAARADGRLAPLADPAAMQATCAGLREDLAGDLARLGVPAALVRGADSRFVSEPAFAAALELRPDLPGIVVGGADHYVPEERPAEVARIIREFAGRVLAGTAQEGVPVE